jgi:hypothetical protein
MMSEWWCMHPDFQQNFSLNFFPKSANFPTGSHNQQDPEYLLNKNFRG